MTSQIDPTVPVEGTPTTASVRAQFQTARDEITALQAAAAAITATQVAVAPAIGTLGTNVQVALTTVNSSFAPLASPALTGVPTAPTPAGGDNDNSLATTAFVQTAVAPALHNVGRNLLHNPLFNIAQRGGGPFTAGGYTLDRWTHALAGDTISVQQIILADADRAQIGDEAVRFSYGNVFTGNAAATAFNLAIQYIEDVRRFAGKTVTFSFWAVNSVAGLKLGVSFGQFFGTGGSPSAAAYGNGVAVTLTAGWARYAVTFAVPSVAGKVLGTDGNDATEFELWFSAGANFAARAGAIGVQSGGVQIGGAQIELGSVATPLEKPDPQDDLARCQRFYYADAVPFGFGFNSWGAGAFSPHIVPLPVAMRAAPTVVLGAAADPINVTTITASGACPTRFVANAFAGGAGGATVNLSGFIASADL